MKSLAILIPLGLAGALLLATTFRAAAPARVAQAPNVVATAVVATAPAIDALPPTPRRYAATLPSPPPTRVPASLPTRLPMALPRSTPPPPTPTPKPTNARPNCDPAYPEQRTCIPPGPPFNQGCAITDQRRFTVLPPDPQRLDADHDGIGCEPIA